MCYQTFATICALAYCCMGAMPRYGHRGLAAQHAPIFYFLKFFYVIQHTRQSYSGWKSSSSFATCNLPSRIIQTNMLHMTFYSLPFTPERPQATEARLEAIYAAAKYGLKGDSLALAAGLTPAQYRRLHEFDPLVEMAELKGRSDGEYMAAKTLHDAATDGDSKAALEILKHQHGWVAKQSLEVSVEGQISVLAALEKAQSRVIEGLYADVTPEAKPLEDNSRNAVTDLHSLGRNGVDVAAVVVDDQG